MIRKSIPSITRLLALVLTVSSLSSCVTKVPVSQAFWQDKTARVAVAVSAGDGRGHFFKEGNQGLLDLAINSAVTAGPDRALSKVKPDTFRKVKGDFVSGLKKRGFQTVEVKDDLQLKNYPKLKGGDGFNSGKDYSSILSSYKADYLIVLSLNGYGSCRPYYGFIPLGVPTGYANASGFMVKKGAAKPFWNTGLGNKSIYPVLGEWDQSPDFKNLTDASLRAIDNSRSGLATDFFN